MKIRKIQSADNLAIATLIRQVMTSFGAVGEGYSIEDPEVDCMAESYSDSRSRYYVVESPDGKVMGGGGIAQLVGGESDTCELKKMYFYPEARGLGLGRAMLEILENDARACGFTKMYLETIARMERATLFYRQACFQPLTEPWGNTGHSKCGLYFAKEL